MVLCVSSFAAVHSRSLAAHVFLATQVQGMTSVQVEVLTEGVTRGDKVLVGSLSVVLGIAAALLIEFLPEGLLDFQWQDAAAECGWLVTSLRRKLDTSMVVCPT